MYLANDPYREFRQAVHRVETEIDLGRAALTIAAADYPNLDIDAYLSRIDGLASAAEARLGGDADVYRSIAALNYVFFKEHGFRGNREQYFDPKNSFLNEVLDRKTGIPISLSVLYIEVARRIGLSLQGIGFPGHFWLSISATTRKSWLTRSIKERFSPGAASKRCSIGCTAARSLLNPNFSNP